MMEYGSGSGDFPMLQIAATSQPDNSNMLFLPKQQYTSAVSGCPNSFAPTSAIKLNANSDVISGCFGYEPPTVGNVASIQIQHTGGLPSPQNELRMLDTNSIDEVPQGVRQFSKLTDPDTIRLICRTNIPGWQNIHPEFICVKQLISGLTNILFAVHVSREIEKSKVNFNIRQVLFRIYGESVAAFYDSHFELEVFKTLEKYRIAPKLIAEFEGGRIEEWIHGLPLTIQNLQNPSITSSIACILGRFHRMHIDMKDFPVHWPRIPICFKNTIKWKDVAKQRWKLFEHRVPLSLSIADLEEEAENLEALVLSNCYRETPATSIVFCHNDTQENNIMRSGTSIRLIDFEYTNFNYAAFDLANLFSEATIDNIYEEYPFFHIDRDRYPCEEHRRLFAAIYLSELLSLPTLPSNQCIDPFLIEVELFTLVVNLYWGFWSFIRAPPVQHLEDFDFIKYGLARLDMYFKKKAELQLSNIIPH